MSTITKGAVVKYSDGTVIRTSVNPQCSDDEIREYFKPGKVFNIGDGPNDKLETVVSVEII